MRLLVYEPDISGHRAEYLRHLMTHSPSDRAGPETVFVVNREFSERYGERPGPASDGPPPEVREVPEQWQSERENAGSLMQRSRCEWRVLQRFTERHSPDHCFLLNLNLFQWALGLPSALEVPYTVSGILFHPFVRLSAGQGGVMEALAVRGSRLRKYWQLRWMLRNEKVTRVHLLNDAAAVERLNGKRGLRPVFSMLPDPVPRYGRSEREGVDPSKRYGIGGERRVFLLFGSLRRNKGALETVRAVDLLAPEVKAKTAFLLVGRVTSDLRAALTEEIRRVRRSDGGVSIVVDDRFVPDEEVPALFRSADVVLAPYQRTEGSSGILGHAARAGKPVIGARSGLVGELIDRYGLGVTVDASSPAAIAAAIERSSEGALEVNGSGRRRYVRERTPERFAEAILRAAVEEASG